MVDRPPILVLDRRLGATLLLRALLLALLDLLDPRRHRPHLEQRARIGVRAGLEGTLHGCV